jgi:hypothetical protein
MRSNGDLGHTNQIAERLRTRTTLARLSLLNQAHVSAEAPDCQQISVIVESELILQVTSRTRVRYVKPRRSRVSPCDLVARTLSLLNQILE